MWNRLVSKIVYFTIRNFDSAFLLFIGQLFLLLLIFFWTYAFLADPYGKIIDFLTPSFVIYISKHHHHQVTGLLNHHIFEINDIEESLPVNPIACGLFQIEVIYIYMYIYICIYIYIYVYIYAYIYVYA
jgi:hypothetical protein